MKLKWISLSETFEWPEGVTVLIWRPRRDRHSHGYLEIAGYWRPDWAKLPLTKNPYEFSHDKETLFARFN